MEKVYTSVLSVLFISLLTLGTAFAASSSSTVATGVDLMQTTPGEPEIILSNVIHTSSQKDLAVDVSLECGLYTRTLVKSKAGTKDTSVADASVKVRVLVDGVEAYPGTVTFCSRAQELSATFGGIFENCEDTDGDGHITLDECDLTDEELELILTTVNANAFNFILDDVGVGDHLIEVEATADWGSSYQTGDAEAKAFVGKGSMTVEEIRLIKDEDKIEM